MSKLTDGFNNVTEAIRGWRKFTVALCTVASATYLTALGQVESSGYVTTMLGVMGLYGLADVAAKKIYYDAEGANGRS